MVSAGDNSLFTRSRCNRHAVEFDGAARVIGSRDDRQRVCGGARRVEFKVLNRDVSAFGQNVDRARKCSAVSVDKRMELS